MKRIRGGDWNSGGDGGSGVVKGDLRLDGLPEECISKVILHTSPRDACVIASVSKTFKSAAESDLVWETFLPAASLVVPRSMNYSSKKEIYLSLADDSVLIDNGKKRLWMEKSSGKKCFMLSAMDLTIMEGDSPDCWQWKSDPESKFEKVAELSEVCWFEIRGKISCRMLSERTHYSAYLVYKKSPDGSFGFGIEPVEARVGFVGKEATKKSVILDPWEVLTRDHMGTWRLRRRPRRRIIREGEAKAKEEKILRKMEGMEEPVMRGDGWIEVELGKFYIPNNNGEDCNDEIEISVMETNYMEDWKGGFIFQGIEIRPHKEEPYFDHKF